MHRVHDFELHDGKSNGRVVLEFRDNVLCFAEVQSNGRIVARYIFDRNVGEMLEYPILKYFSIMHLNPESINEFFDYLSHAIHQFGR